MSCLILSMGLSLLLSSCGQVEFKNTDITGADFAKNFSLIDHHGKPRQLSDFKGQVVLMFFGYTQCPDVCPTTLSELKNVMTLLGADAKKFQVLFASVDPERDTQDLLARYVPAFDPSFLGLTGSAEQIAKVTKDFKIIHYKVPGKTAGSYTVDHSSGSYIFDAQGQPRLYVRHAQTAEAIAHDVKALLK